MLGKNDKRKTLGASNVNKISSTGNQYDHS